MNTSKELNAIQKGFAHVKDFHATPEVIDREMKAVLSDPTVFRICHIQKISGERLHGKFLPAHWVLIFDWKNGLQSEPFKTEVEANLAEEAYTSQIVHSPNYSAWKALKIDNLRAKVEANLKAVYGNSVSSLQARQANVQKALARRDISSLLKGFKRH